jgi:hypothetical protein
LVDLTKMAKANRAKLSKTGDGFVALGIPVIVYGIVETVHGYGSPQYS